MDVRAATSLEQEYEALQPLIEAVHPRREGRLNAVEFVHDVAGEHERQEVNSDEESPYNSDDPPSPPPAADNAFLSREDSDFDDDIVCSQAEDFPFFESML